MARKMMCRFACSVSAACDLWTTHAQLLVPRGPCVCVWGSCSAAWRTSVEHQSFAHLPQPLRCHVIRQQTTNNNNNNMFNNNNSNKIKVILFRLTAVITLQSFDSVLLAIILVVQLKLFVRCVSVCVCTKWPLTSIFGRLVRLDSLTLKFKR